jgi:hypothetical protein
MLASGADPIEAAVFGTELASEAAGVSGIEAAYSLVRNRVFSA